MSRSLLLAVALLSGCAMTESECRGTDWYQLGYRDGDPYGLRPAVHVYEHQCRAWVQANEADYLRGWVDGYREFSKKMTGSECCAP